MKIDLRELEEDVRAWVFHHDETLALIRVARAAKAALHAHSHPWEGNRTIATYELHLALSDIEDSKQ